MNPMVTAVVSLLGGWRATAFLGLALVALSGWGIQSWRLDSAHAERDAARQTADLAVAASATNLQTIHELQTANASWANKNAADAKRAADAVAAVERERDALLTEVEKRRASRDRLYEHDANAAAWGRTVVPRSIVDGLRN